MKEYASQRQSRDSCGVATLGHESKSACVSGRGAGVVCAIVVARPTSNAKPNPIPRGRRKKNMVPPSKHAPPRSGNAICRRLGRSVAYQFLAFVGAWLVRALWKNRARTSHAPTKPAAWARN